MEPSFAYGASGAWADVDAACGGGYVVDADADADAEADVEAEAEAESATGGTLGTCH